jgi:hypothetical protein
MPAPKIWRLKPVEIEAASAGAPPEDIAEAIDTAGEQDI